MRKCASYVKSKYVYILHKLLPQTEKNQLYAFMGKYGLSHIPYPFILEYKKMPIPILWDEHLNLCFVNHNGKKLYFPYISKEYITQSYKMLLMEQHILSPHQYLEDTNRLKGKTILDIGAAEGIFTLNVIEIVDHVYLFECEEIWINALIATFAPWKEKVTIVTKYVSDINDEKNVTIDQFLEGKNKTNLFLKMDVEGYELAALKGAEKTIQEAKDIDFSICTYHKKVDSIQFKQFFEEHSIETEYSDGFVYHENDFRKAIIRRKY